ncbi:restriction endonuclease subunit S [Aeromonas dhakensis]|uniref:restriction endonuclease subunit S n=1 Tax=Aeromonas TaxID=642 RepID=UPI00259ECD23|nr:restriction endonuclease subunit S [Aeromonas dhakensis]MDM5055657.1 restriction endonuclease subunit S [Aeromonas dhakensis]MDM5081921.1 restriction endonuclease subunit S [Aeromonas dhakensis]
MKAGWTTKTIADVCSVVNGGTPKTGVSEYWDGAHQWITPAEMGKRSTPYVAKTERTITDAGIQNSSARLLPPLSVILSSRAPIGHLVINTEPMATNQGCKGLVPSDDLNHKYLYYYLSSIVHLLNDLGAGATFKELSGGKLKEVPIPLPPLAEQQRIVAILDEAFEAIAAARANAEQNRQNARALFESYLQSVFSQRGEGWTEKPLSEVASILNGYAFKSGDFSSNGPTKSIKITNVGVRDFVETSDSGLPPNFSEQYASVAVPAGSLVIALTRTIIADGLKVAIVPPAYDRALVNQRVAALLPKPEQTSVSYLFAYLSTSIVLNYVKERVNTLMQPNLSINDLRAMPIPLPPASERECIIDRLEVLEERTQHLETLYQRKIAALDELKQSLLQQAFSGYL